MWLSVSLQTSSLHSVRNPPPPDLSNMRKKDLHSYSCIRSKYGFGFWSLQCHSLCELKKTNFETSFCSAASFFPFIANGSVWLQLTATNFVETPGLIERMPRFVIKAFDRAAVTDYTLWASVTHCVTRRQVCAEDELCLMQSAYRRLRVLENHYSGWENINNSTLFFSYSASPQLQDCGEKSI